jgi:hypothetical protein
MTYLHNTLLGLASQHTRFGGLIACTGSRMALKSAIQRSHSLLQMIHLLLATHVPSQERGVGRGWGGQSRTDSGHIILISQQA